MSQSRFLVSWFSYLALVVAAGCGRPPEGAAQVVARALSAADVASLSVTVTGTGISSPLVNELSREGNNWVGVIGRIPAGTDRTFLAQSFDAAGMLLYQGQATGVTISPGQTAVVVIVAQQVAPPVPFQNAAPVTSSLVASAAEIAPGATLSLDASAHDPDGDALTYAWQGPAGSFSAPASSSTLWTAPSLEGAYDLQLTVTDAKGATSTLVFSAAVAAGAGRGRADVGVTVNTAPNVTGVSASPSRIDVGQTTALDVTASDPDGDALAYAWSAGCEGSFSAPTVKSPSFTLSALPMGGSCVVTISVSDGRGGTNLGTITIVTGPAPPANLAPQVDSTYQSSSTANAGDPVRFRVQSTDPEGAAIAFAWSAGVGTLGTVTTAGGTSEVVWTAPSCFPGGSTAQVSVGITDPAGGATTETFSVGAGTIPGNCSGKIVFMGSGDGDPEIYTLNPDGTGLTKLTDNSVDDDAPMFSPTGAKIAFRSNRDGNAQLYIMNANGSGQTRLTNNAASDRTPGWSPDGSRIAFTSDRDGNDEIYVMNADGTAQTRLTNTPAGEGVARFSPDGQKILFGSNRDDPSSEIYVMNPDGTGQTRLTFAVGTQDGMPRWSPNGKIIWRKDFGGFSQADLWTMNADGSSQSRLLDGPDFDSEGTYSPDGTKIIFSTFRDRNGGGEIYIMNADTTGQMRLTFSLGHEGDLDWGPAL